MSRLLSYAEKCDAAADVVVRLRAHDPHPLHDAVFSTGAIATMFKVVNKRTVRTAYNASTGIFTMQHGHSVAHFDNLPHAAGAFKSAVQS